MMLLTDPEPAKHLALATARRSDHDDLDQSFTPRHLPFAKRTGAEAQITVNHCSPLRLSQNGYGYGRVLCARPFSLTPQSLTIV